MPTYHVENFGCRTSQADGEAIARQLDWSGFTTASPADLVVVNSCSVTAEAEKTARAYIRRVRRDQPEARIVVTGCYAQRAPQEVAALPGVHAVIGNSHKSLVAAVAAHSLREDPTFVPLEQLAAVYADDFAHSNLSTLPLAGLGATPGRTPGRTRPVLKVQDGCGNRCSFCIIPTTRGPSRSTPLEECVAAARAFAAAGGKELVLSGINLGRWGSELAPRRSLAELVHALLEQTDLPRLRLSSVEPMDWSDELLAVFSRYSGRHPRLARHFHVPLQSGSDEILRRMHRRYRPWHYAARLAHMRAVAPEAAIGADVMVGFPGETDAHFRESYDFIAAAPLTYLHLFPFSPRPGTPAAARPRPARAAVDERLAALRVLMAGKTATFMAAFRGRRLSAVTLAGGSDALSDNFLSVRLGTLDRQPQKPGANRMIEVQVTSIETSEAGILSLAAVPIAEGRDSLQACSVSKQRT